MRRLSVYRLGILNGTLRRCLFSYSERTTLKGTLQARFAVYRLESEQPRSASFREIAHFSKRRISAQTIRQTAKCGDSLRKPEITPQSTHCAPLLRGKPPPKTDPTEAIGRAVHRFWRSASVLKWCRLRSASFRALFYRIM